MKGIYLSNLDPLKAKGYDTKILGQIQGFNQLGADLDLICFVPGNRVVLKTYNSQSESEVSETTLSFFTNNLLIKRIHLYRNALNRIKQISPDFLYLRNPRSDPLYLYWLKSVKNLLPHIIILSEIPTYPYDREYINCQSIKDKLLITLDKLTRKKLKQYIDIITVVAYQGNVFGIPSLNINNGINISQIKQINNTKSINHEIQIIGVANVDFWHGYDRVISGLKEYYHNHNNKLKLLFHIISPIKDTISQLKDFTMSYGLSDYVLFHGSKHGEELDKIFNQCHIAVGDLASHRKGLKQTAALKAREYTARGIPFISSVEDPDFSEEFPYILKVAADDNPIDIQQVIDFAKAVYQDTEHSVKMRDYAAQHLDWSIKMKPVIETVKVLTDKKNRSK